jgi:uncharacterized protein
MELATNHKDAILYIKECPNLYGDTTMVDTDDVIKEIRFCGSKKILFGSDEVVFGKESYKKYDNLKEKLGNMIYRMEVENLFCNNAKQIF